jgi:hypothetical protein
MKLVVDEKWVTSDSALVRVGPGSWCPRLHYSSVMLGILVSMVPYTMRHVN